MVDKAYISWLHTQPCCVCGRLSGIEAAHVGRRGLGQKCSDLEAIPLCSEHHRTGPAAHHVLGKWFWSFHSIDREAIIEKMNKRLESIHSSGV